MHLLTDQSPPRLQQAGNVKILTLTGLQVADLENPIAWELEGHTDDLAGGHLLLDFRNVRFIQSLELGTLITLHKRIKESGGRLTLFNLNPQVYEVFAVCRLHAFLEICRHQTLE